MMFRTPFLPHRHLMTEALRVAVPLETKVAVDAAAQRRGVSAAAFVRDAVERPDCRAIVGVVAELGRRLGIETVAEGVETPAQLAVVHEEGFTEGQGYLFGRAVMASPAARAAGG